METTFLLATFSLENRARAEVVPFLGNMRTKKPEELDVT